jgi:hypothetical protein
LRIKVAKSGKVAIFEQIKKPNGLEEIALLRLPRFYVWQPSGVFGNIPMLATLVAVY